MEDPRLKIIAKVLCGYTGECTCDKAYTGRNLIDPHCVFHLVPNEEAAADIIAALDAMEGEGGASQELEEPKWNVFLHNPARKYQDYMVTVQARTGAEAEAKALSENDGAAIAHPAQVSPYSLAAITEWDGVQSIAG